MSPRYSALLLALAATPAIRAQDNVTPELARANFARRIELAADDRRAFPDAPAGFDQPLPDSAARGRVESLDYPSVVTGTTRVAKVYLPPGYSPAHRYPVLYLLHGIGGDPYEWIGYVRAAAILDRLIADGAAVPMIVVMPNGRALPDDRPPASDKVFTPENAAGFAKFERDLFECLIPAVDAGYATLADRGQRALAGLSMGGGQAINFGLAHLDAFAWLGGFSPAPNTRPLDQLVSDSATTRARLKLFYLSCGNRDGLINISQAVHTDLKARDIPHVWNVDDAGHERTTWANNLHHFARLLFRGNPEGNPGEWGS